MSNSQVIYTPEDLEAVSCPVCDESKTKHLVTEFSINIVQCQNCGLLYTNPRPRNSEKNYWALSRAEMEKKYGAVFNGTKPHDRDTLYRSHLATIAHYKPQGRFLDVGTHCGFFLRHTQHHAWEAEGIEPSPISSEHLHNVGEMLNEIQRILKPGGVFFIKTPNGTYNHFKHLVFHQLLRKPHYDCFDAHEHVAAYTVATLTRLLNKLGWQVITAMPSAPVQTYGSHPIKIIGRNVLYSFAQIQHALTKQPGPFATDIIVLATKSSPPL
jgi:Zn ribbon nucleic-acid-binding protein